MYENFSNLRNNLICKASFLFFELCCPDPCFTGILKDDFDMGGHQFHHLAFPPLIQKIIVLVGQRG